VSPVKASSKAIASLRDADPVMARLIEQNGAVVRRDLKRERPGDAYGTLVRAIVGQQLSSKAAATIYGRVLSRAKVDYLRDLAQHVEDGALELELLPELPDEEVAEQLTAIKGLGQWTADMFLMFHLGRPDILPVGDQGIRRAIQVEYGLRKLPDAKRMRKIAKPWQPYRTLACLYLWSSLDNTPA
jgi:DNA-3-methyladenine glycosylase II